MMVKRADPPDKGKWALPGGHLEAGEELEQAAIREAREETGLEIQVKGLLGFKNLVLKEGEGFHIVLFCFEGVCRGGELRKGPDVFNVEWVVPKRIPKVDISPPTIDFLRTKGLV